MRILGIYLENIRSYKKSYLILPPKDVITIYGHTGSGKTSLLMAIRFALFGLPQKGPERDLFSAYKDPHGADLLRVDSTRGKVRLIILLRGKLYLIERVIERKGNSYTSTEGLIEEYEIEDGRIKLKSRKFMYTRGELDDYMIRLLGIRERKSEKGTATPLVYSTALYVPQFNTHEVLQLSEEQRIEIIERALGLDKYKLFKYNYEKVSKKLDELIKEKTQIYNYHRENLMKKNKEKLSKELNSMRLELVRLENEEKILNSEYNRVKELEEDIRREIQRLENERKDLQSQINEYNEKLRKLREVENIIIEKINTSPINEKVLENYMNILDEKIEESKKAIEELNKAVFNLNREVELKEKEKSALDQEYSIISAQIAGLKKEIDITHSNIEDIEKERGNIEDLINRGLCPVCRQQIPHEHGLKLLKDVKDELANLKVKLNSLQNQLGDLVNKQEIVERSRKTAQLTIYELKGKLQDLSKKREELLKGIQRLLEIKLEIASLINNWKALKEELSRVDVKAIDNSIKSIEREVENKREVLFQVESNIRQIIEKKSEIAREIGRLKGLLDSIERELSEISSLEQELERLRKELDRLRGLKELFEYSYKAVEEIEKQVLKRLIDEFRIIFYQYLSTLIRDQPVEVVVTDDFNVVEKIRIGRAVYSTPSLSGGQNIAIGLAYRLALNQVVRRHSKFLQKSVLILDEPTTGFSSELVSRLKELLKNMSGEEGQVIVVTHDTTLIEAGDCRIKLSLDPEEHKTIIDYEECLLDEEYKELVENILLGRITSRQSETITYKRAPFEPRVEGVKSDSSKTGWETIVDYDRKT